MNAYRHLVTVATLSLAAMASPASANMNMALERGCLNCHGTPPRGKAPTIADLAKRFAAAKGNEAEMAKLSGRLREHHLFGGVKAHERLTEEEATTFVRWLTEGGQ